MLCSPVAVTDGVTVDSAIGWVVLEVVGLGMEVDEKTESCVFDAISDIMGFLPHALKTAAPTNSAKIFKNALRFINLCYLPNGKPFGSKVDSQSIVDIFYLIYSKNVHSLFKPYLFNVFHASFMKKEPQR
jgi:hypothetical protein